MNDAEVDRTFDRVCEAVMSLPHDEIMRFADRANRSLVFVLPTIPPIGLN